MAPLISEKVDFNKVVSDINKIILYWQESYYQKYNMTREMYIKNINKNGKVECRKKVWKDYLCSLSFKNVYLIKPLSTNSEIRHWWFLLKQI